MPPEGVFRRRSVPAARGRTGPLRPESRAYPGGERRLAGIFPGGRRTAFFEVHRPFPAADFEPNGRDGLTEAFLPAGGPI